MTIDIDATDVEVYGSRKRGVSYTYQGSGRPAARSVLGGDRDPAVRRSAGRRPDPRSSVVALLRRALAALPRSVRDAAAAAARKIALRADASYFASYLSLAAAAKSMAFAIGAKPITSMWRALRGIRRGCLARRDRHVQRAGRGLPLSTCDWPDGTALLVRRVRLYP